MITDVLIIGGGITARRASQIVAEKYSVILLSDGAGASPYIHGLNVPLLPEDSTELFLKDTLESGKHQNDKALAKALVHGSLSVIEEFKAEFDKADDGSYDLLKPLGSSVPRVAGIGGRTGVKALRDLHESKNYKELSPVRAVRIIKDGERAIGAVVFDKNINEFYNIYARAILIATGGFGGIFPFSTNSPDIGGDGAAMAYDAGAEMVDMEFIQYEPTVATAPKEIIGKSIITTMLFEGAVIRNKDGERFMDEKVGKDVLSAGIYREILRGGAAKTGAVYYDMTNVPEDMLLGKYRDYFERYKNVSIDIRRTPVEITPAPHTTMGGIKIDAECRTTVKGLFAAGEAAGGIHGANRLGGNAGLEVFVFGDIAGRSIVRYLGENDISMPEDKGEHRTSEHFDASSERAELDEICATALGVIKSGKKLKEVRGRVEKITRIAALNIDSYEAVRLHNDAITLSLVIEASVERTESVGSHIREDGTAFCGAPYRIILKKENGTLTKRRETIK